MPRSIAIRAARLIDGTGGAPVEDAVVVVQGEQITAVGASKSVSAPENAEQIDLGNRTLLPGFIDAHSHATINPGLRGIIGQLEGANEPSPRQVLRGARNLRIDLASGVTTMRLVGEVPYNDLTLRQAISDGYISGPRLLVSGRAITSSNGHGSLVPAWIVDGADEMRRVVREQLRMGCDFTKLIVTGRRYVKNATEYLGFTESEIAAAIEETHRVGSRIGAHLRMDLDTGLRLCLEHGLDLTDHVFPVGQESIDLFLSSDATAVPTYTIALQTQVDWNLLHGKPIADRLAHVRGLDEERLSQTEFDDSAVARRVSFVRDEAPDAFRKAAAAGVKYCLGTDAMHGLFAYEMEILASWDIPEMDAIVAGTMSGARALGIENETGSLEPGKLADIIAVDGNPLEDITTLGNVSFVMRAGRRYDPAALLDDVPA
ncbi:MAG TPA: amidohydrolase family protein [Thermomicrobiales bacterium]|nr:amidohydrolase family protein [Thermomicrobiales bacterium]